MSEPHRLGNYLIHGLLGEGGMARIYAGEEVLSHRRVALKVLRAEFAASAQGRRQFLNEMAILANIDDPHIVRCLACVEIDEQPVMILEHLEGWTLRAMLEARVALPWREAAHYAMQIAKALHTAHSLRPPVIHRDLKPENVMILRDARVKVMDFGIAKIIQDISGSATSQPMGTLQYMSPEHIDARGVDGRSDLFSLGLVFWEMLAGRPAFVHGSPRVLLDQICNQPAPPLPDRARQDLPPQIEQLITRMLAKDPRDRPSGAGEVALTLEAALAGRPPRQAPPSRPQAPPSRPPHLDTAAIIEDGRTPPLQQQIEDRVDELSEAVNRFGRATSAWIIRVLVGLLITPAAAVGFMGLTALADLVVLAVLADGGVRLRPNELLALDPDDVAVVMLISFVVATVVFIRACWTHRREPGGKSGRRLWLGLGGLLIGAWIGAVILEITGSDLNQKLHGVLMVSASAWMSVTLAWLFGRMLSPLLARLGRAR